MALTTINYSKKLGSSFANFTICTPIPGTDFYTEVEDQIFDLEWNNEGVLYHDVFHQAEKEFSAYNFEHANTDYLFKIFDMLEDEAKKLLEKNLSLPAYDQCLKASHVFNILDARGVISVAQRAEYISRIRELTKSTGKIWLETQN